VSKGTGSRLCHSSDAACEGVSRRAGGAKGRAEQVASRHWPGMGRGAACASLRRRSRVRHVRGARCVRGWKGVRERRLSAPKLRRVQELAEAKPEERFTSLAHPIMADVSDESDVSDMRKAAAGVDGVTKEAYGQNLEENLKLLHGRLKSGEYRATPVLRVFIEKPDGGKRPLGIPSLEDKIVQGAVVEILNCIYESDFTEQPGPVSCATRDVWQAVESQPQGHW
jgi:hypothetical protein